jgi:HEAT repeat protein
LGSELYIKESKDAMMEIITDNSENQNLRSECLFMVPAKGETYGGKPIGEYLIQIFREEKELRPMAAMRLGSIKYEPALDILIQSAKEDSLKPIMALGAMGNKRALPVMFDLLKEKKYRAQIAEQMGRIGGSDVMDTLMNLAVKDEDPIVRSCAKMGLAWTDNEKAYEFLIKNHCVETLGRAAWYGRFKALYALKKVGTPKAIKKLKWLSNLEGSGMPDIRNAAKELLKEIEYEKE